MINKFFDNIGKSKLKMFMFFYSLYILVFYAVNFYIQGTSLDINSIDINAVNMLLNVIAIPSCAIYYLMEKNDVIFIYILIYMSAFIENTYCYLSGQETKIIILLFTYRTILLAYTIYADKKKLKSLKKSRKYLICKHLMLNIVIIAIDPIVTSNMTENTHTDILKVLVMLSYIIVVRLIMETNRRKNFVESIFAFGIITLGIRLWLMYILEKNFFLDKLIPSNQTLFFFTYSAILIGLFVESIFVINENKKLNKDVQIISDNIEKLKEMENLRIEFFANLSHELKTPINILYSSFQVLGMNRDKDEKLFIGSYDKYRRFIKQNCYRLIRLTNNLVDITKINSGFMEMKFRNVDIIGLTEEITMSVVQYVANKKISIIFDTMVEEHIIKCDVDAVERIILNLLSNSIKFSKDKGYILVSTDVDDDNVIIKVRDNGIGITKDNRELLFEPFIQGDKSLTRENEGSGIGLSLVKSLVELHNGTICFGDVSDGTEVIVKLPNVKNENEDVAVSVPNAYDENLVLKINIEFSDIYNMEG